MSQRMTARRNRDQRVAAGWRGEHATYEQLLKLPATEREAMLERLGGTYRIAFGNYQVTKAAHERVEKGTDQ